MIPKIGDTYVFEGGGNRNMWYCEGGEGNIYFHHSKEDREVVITSVSLDGHYFYFKGKKNPYRKSHFNLTHLQERVFVKKGGVFADGHPHTSIFKDLPKVVEKTVIPAKKKIVGKIVKGNIIKGKSAKVIDEFPKFPMDLKKILDNKTYNDMIGA